jgi:hypothetical protein
VILALCDNIVVNTGTEYYFLLPRIIAFSLPPCFFVFPNIELTVPADLLKKLSWDRLEILEQSWERRKI